MDPFSPDNTRFNTSALYSGPPPRKLSRVQREMPNSTIQQTFMRLSVSINKLFKTTYMWQLIKDEQIKKLGTRFSHGSKENFSIFSGVTSRINPGPVFKLFIFDYEI